MSTKRAIIRFDKVGYAVGNTAILAALELEIFEGEVMILLGESGCGKTTTLKLINRLIEPTSGEIYIEERLAREWNAIQLRRKVGYVLQEAGLFPHLTVAQNVAVVPRLLGWSETRKQERMKEMLQIVGLEPGEFADRFPHELSGGQRQRVGVARALAADPKIVLLDEPFGALDAITRTNLQKEFARLVRELGKTAVLVTHDLHEAMLLGSRITLMDKGRILSVHTPDNFAESDLPLARAYLDTVLVSR